MSDTLLLKAALLWDGLSDAASPHAAIRISDGHIAAIGPDAAALPADRVLEWLGATLMPGFIDSHTHLSMDGTLDDYLDHMADPIATLSLRAAAMMRRDLRAGVTTCRCLGDREFLDIACRQAVQTGLAEGPRLLVATRGIRAPQGHGFVGYPFAGPQEIRRAVEENIEAGADLIKIYISGTLKGDGVLPSYLTRREISMAIDTAHQAGRRVAAHCVGGQGLDWALELGLDTLEHAYHITDRQIEALARSATRLVLTPGAMLSEERIRRLPARLIPGHLAERQIIFERMAACIAAGIPFAVGTDGLHGGLAREVAYLVEMGAPLHTALQAATINGAGICGRQVETGSLEVGKVADIIAVRGNPLEDVAALTHVLGVISAGRPVEVG